MDALTTCCRAFEDDWSRNTLRPGIESIDGVRVHRYPVDARDRRAFTRVNSALLRIGPGNFKRGVSPLEPDDEATFFREGIRSRALSIAIAERAADYDAVVLLPYLYGPIVEGVARAGRRALLQPCLHDESYAYLDEVAKAHYSARRLLFNSTGEAELARRLYGPGIAPKSRVLGLGIDSPVTVPQESVGGFVPQRERYVLYAGRQDATKNLNLAVGAFDAYRRRYRSSELKLVLVGDRSASFARHDGIVDLGYVSEDAKWTLLAHARALVQPSLNESYSRVMFESWLVGRPVVAHGACLATALAVRESNGGWTASSATDWEAAFARIDGDDRDLDAFGERGRAYAQQYAAWDGVLERFAEIVREIGEPPIPVQRKLRTTYGDAARPTRDFADALDVRLTRAGIAIGANAAPELVHVETDDDVRAAAPNAALIVHGEVSATALLREAPIFAPLRSQCEELRKAGIDAHFLPFPFDERRWERLPDRELSANLQDGNTNLVFSGPFRSLEPLDSLLEAFLDYVRLDGAVRLCLIATGDIDEDVYGRVRDLIYQLNLVENVVLLHEPSDAERLAIFRNATLFWSMGDTDRLGVELRTAMLFDAPVIAYDEPIARELIGPAGIVFTSRDELVRIAALAKVVADDPALRRTIVTAQQNVAAAYNDDAALARLRQWLDGA